jgi:hypothetical protein
MDPLEEKRMFSYFSRIPSIDLTDYEYHIFLTCATAEELEKDILKKRNRSLILLKKQKNVLECVGNIRTDFFYYVED